jgi:hypothetical protein
MFHRAVTLQTQSASEVLAIFEAAFEAKEATFLSIHSASFVHIRQADETLVADR